MEISYTDFSGKKLEIDQLPDIEDYIKVFKENNRLQKKEFYIDNLFINEFYFIEYGKSHRELLSLNLISIKICEIEYLTSNYTKNHNHSYYNSTLNSKSISIYINNKSIFYQEICIEDNSAIYNKTKKYYESDGRYEFIFQYNHTGHLAWVIVSNDSLTFYEQYRPSDLDLIPNFEWWEKYSSYYLNAEPAVPVDIVT
ncbi:hypothetical protein Q765_12380 [Flavobacterium rivuli WB 3.3-2 = DSM 21788]|uniref:Uncharacterized protein n=1 Tax=Flavobacterium rivuli WB 3.3-2 = DSM 21788 TaxID=1121895 RepID=A0A0A2M0F7_9FLAO|nr:hypothetical protein [Flavobacterium rivuli]KGO86107.1 hypothetical protein Q765_12380 [Flavobacterium rivuli WB 3.3-2 = DSM 21788]